LILQDLGTSQALVHFAKDRASKSFNQTAQNASGGNMKTQIGRQKLASSLMLILSFSLMIAPRAEAAQYVYDDANRLRWVEYGNGKVVEHVCDGEGNRVKSLNNEPPPSEVSVSSRQVDYGMKTVGSNSSQVLTVYNNGSSDLVLGNLTLSDTNYQFGTNNCNGQTIGPNGSCNVEIIFHPGSSIASGASLSVPSSESAFSLLLGGEGSASPPVQAILINGDSEYANSVDVSLALSASYPPNVTDMCISNTSSCTAWNGYVSSPTWTLAGGDGTKFVYVKFRNASGVVSNQYYDSIVLDTAPPTGSVVINGGASYTTATQVNLTLSASDAASGVSQMRFSNDGSSWSAWEPFATLKARTLPSGDGTKTVYVQYRDKAGNASGSYSASILLDASAPAAPSNFHFSGSNFGEVILSWNANSEGDLSGYRIYYGSSSRSYGAPINAGNVTSHTLTGLNPLRTYFYGVTAYDLHNHESGYSTEVSGVFPLSANIGIYGNGDWFFDNNGNGVWEDCGTDICYENFGGGLTGAVPVTGDWDGTGTAKIGIYVDGLWYLDLNGNGAWDGAPTDGLIYFGGGLTGAVPVTGDWTGTGTTKIGVYVDGEWYLDLNGNGAWDGTPTDGLVYFGGGLTGAVPVTGDWTGTGTAKIGVYVDGEWYLDLSGNRVWDGTPTDGLYSFVGNLTGAVPVTGDWTGTGTAKIGIYHDGAWYLDLNGNGSWNDCPVDGCINSFEGIAGDIPVIKQKY
jgi:hypothetical protein